MRIEVDTINLKENLVLKEVFDGVVFETKKGELLCVSYTKKNGFEIGVFERGIRNKYSVKDGQIIRK